MSKIARLLAYLTFSIFVVSGAKAQVVINPAPQHLAVCPDKADAYKLALADMQNTLAKTWEEFVKEGRCRFMPAQYLFTIDNYKDNVDTPSRVVEMLAFGERVWGIRADLPTPGVWLIDHDAHPQDLPLHDKFYKTWAMPNSGNERKVSCCSSNDCYPTPIKKIDGKWYARRREDGVWMFVPDYKLEQNQPDPRESPDYQSHACMQPPNMTDQVYCATLGEGI